ncbi:hypothetical protein AMTRI_Chr08g206380 [Amborella trichopoda]
MPGSFLHLTSREMGMERMGLKTLSLVSSVDRMMLMLWRLNLWTVCITWQPSRFLKFKTCFKMQITLDLVGSFWKAVKCASKFSLLPVDDCLCNEVLPSGSMCQTISKTCTSPNDNSSNCVCSKRLATLGVKVKFVMRIFYTAHFVYRLAIVLM